MESSHGGRGPCCFICLSPIDFARKPGPSSQILKQNINSFSTLGKVFNISKVFIDPFLSGTRGGERPLQCGVCLKSLSQLSGVQEQLEILNGEVQTLQKQLLVKLKQLAKVVGVTQRNKKNIHENLIKSDSQLQRIMRGGRGGFCGGLVSPELYSLRQLILGALMMSGSNDHSPQIPVNMNSCTSFPNNFVAACGSKDIEMDNNETLEEDSPDFPQCVVVKVEAPQNVQEVGNHTNFDKETGDLWNGYILVNEDEPQPNADNFVYEDEDDGGDVVVSEDGGSDYTPSPNRRKGDKHKTRMDGTSSCKRKRFDVSCSDDSDVEYSTMETAKQTTSSASAGNRTVMKLLRRLELRTSEQDSTLKSLLRDKDFIKGMQGDVEVKERLAGLKFEDTLGDVDAEKLSGLMSQVTEKFNGLVDQVEKCFSNNSVLRRQMIEIKSAVQENLDKVTENNQNRVKWPARIKEDIEEIEKQLEDPSVYQAEVQGLSRIGGNTRSKIVYNTIRSIVTTEVAKNIRFTDKTGKIAFGELKMASLVRDAIKTGNPTMNFTDDRINDLLKCWFRNNIDRRKPVDEPRKKV